MIVVVANRWSSVTEALAVRWAAHNVGILTPADLSTSGWVQHLGDAGTGTAVIGGERVPQREITAVLPLMPCVFEEELTSIVPEDRTYVAAEMTSFLFCWLSRLPCHVFNRPTPPCLSGPFWRPERWVHLAAHAGIPVETVRRRTAPNQRTLLQPEDARRTAVTVLGTETFGEAHRTLHHHALTLARRAGVEVLEVQFSHPGANALLHAAHTLPDLSPPELADATLALLQRTSPV